MAGATNDDVKKKSKTPPGWGVGFFIAAAVFFFIVDDKDRESVENLPAIISFVVLVVGKMGLVGGCIGLGVGLTVWEIYVKSESGKVEMTEEEAGAQEQARALARRPAAGPRLGTGSSTAAGLPAAGEDADLPFADPISEVAEDAGLIPIPDPGEMPSPHKKLKGRMAGSMGFRRGTKAATTTDEDGVTSPPPPEPPPFRHQSPGGGIGGGVQLSSAKYLNNN
jgi:hypothetical protein